jgi:hypothetical protein
MHLQNIDKLVHEIEEEDLTTDFLLIRWIPESPVSEGYEKWAESSVI